MVQQSGRVTGVGADQCVQSPAGLPVPTLRPRPHPDDRLGAAAVPTVGLFSLQVWYFVHSSADGRSSLQVWYFVHSSADGRSVSSSGVVLCAQQC